MKPPKMDKGRREWLAGLKAGAEVAWVTDTLPVRIVRIVGVARKPPDFVVDDEPVKNGHCRATFTRKTGKGRVGTFRPTRGWIVPVTDELRKEHSVEVVRQRLCAVRFNRFSSDAPPDEKILAIAAILWPEDFGDGK